MERSPEAMLGTKLCCKKRKRDERLHIDRTTTVKKASPCVQPKWIACPALTVHRHDVGAPDKTIPPSTLGPITAYRLDLVNSAFGA